MRKQAGFNLASTELRAIYGNDKSSIPLYSSTKGYLLDEQVKYNGVVYRAKQEIQSPAGGFNPQLWLPITDEGSSYDGTHCNERGYLQSVDILAAWMRTL